MTESKEEDAARTVENDTDDEGLALHYDVILYGTGLVQSIVASAVARAGKSVLHCDPADYYGSYDAVWTLPYVTSPDGLASSSSTFQHDTKSMPKEEDESLLPLSSQSESAGLKVHSLQKQPDPESYSIAKPHSLVWTVYGLARVDSVELINGGASVQLALSLTSCKPFPKENPSDDDKHPKLCLSVSTRDLELDDPTSPSQEALQQAVDRFHRKKRQEEQEQTSGTATPIRKTAGIESLQSQKERVDEEILQQRGRSFALDVSPGLLFAFGPAVQGLLQSSVAEYVEFKSLEKLLYYSDSTKGKGKAPQLLPVPCSKNDVFSSKLLSPMEKRRIMKFLQLALDYSLLLAEEEELEEIRRNQESEKSNDPTSTAPSSSDEAVTSWNERHLNQGRSLARPQNKAVNTEDMAILQECMKSSDDSNGASVYTFERYLAEKQKLSPSLISLVRFALSLEPVYVKDSNSSSSNNSGGTPSSSSLRDGMLRLCRHMQALGRFGSTAFLVPLYGSGELSQAFCRSAAVYGATYLLRRSLKGVTLEKENDPNGGKVSGVILLPQQDMEGPETANSAKEPKRVACTHVIVPEQLPLSNPSTQKRVLRRISIIRGKPLAKTADEQQRMAIIVPPNSTTKNTYTIHGLLLDETVNVAPHLSVKEPRTGCSVLHLSTVIDDAESEDSGAVLETAVDQILREQVNERGDCEEIFHISFSIPFIEDAPDAETPHPTRGLHVVHRAAPGMIVDTAFEQAKEIFTKICPNDEFLVLAKEIDTMVKERFGERDEDDDEKRVLESAMDMIGEKAVEAPTEAPLPGNEAQD